MQNKQPFLERSPVICQRCARPFDHLTIEEIEGLNQLRCGNVIIPRAEIICLHCGWVFHWSIREKDLSKMAVTYGVILESIRSYAPE